MLPGRSTQLLCYGELAGARIYVWGEGGLVCFVSQPWHTPVSVIGTATGPALCAAREIYAITMLR